MMIGVSAHTVEEAVRAVKGGADCLGVGAMFSTSTKADASVLPKATLRDICAAVDVPVVAIGGINKSNIMQLAGTGVRHGALRWSARYLQPTIQKANAAPCASCPTKW